MTPPEPPKLSTAQRKALAPPNDDIGPFYKMLGAMVLLGGLGLAFIHVLHDREMSITTALIILLMVLSSLALIRPNKFDEIVKLIADRLPFFSYKKGP